MIKMDYGDKKRLKMLIDAYPKIFPDMNIRQSCWANLRKRLSNIDARFKTMLPKSYEAMLVLDYESLADIYEVYDGLDLKKNAPKVYADSKAYFSYEKSTDSKGNTWEKLQPLIAGFFMDERNGFEIHTCHYCDMAYVNPFDLPLGKKAQFDLDHVLNKARCPIVGLSLFNFVPSCQMCNGSRIKGQKQIYPDARLRRKLSPSNFNYDFEGKVTIEVINKYGNCSTIGFEKRMSEYDLRFNTYLDPDYEEEIKAFYLTERYNYHKCEALRLLDLKERYTDAKIMELARLIAGGSNSKVSPHGMKFITQLKHDIFATEFNHRHHRCLGKLHDDMLK